MLDVRGLAIWTHQRGRLKRNHWSGKGTAVWSSVGWSGAGWSGSGWSGTGYSGNGHSGDGMAAPAVWEKVAPVLTGPSVWNEDKKPSRISGG